MDPSKSQPLAAADNSNTKPDHACIPATSTAKKNVTFRPTLTETTQIPHYDRTATPVDVFSCDVCGDRIPGGIKGFEVYGTCLVCPDGYDVCGICCGLTKFIKVARKALLFSPEKPWPLKKVKHHKHALHVVDRGAEVLWANDGFHNASKTVTTKAIQPANKNKRSNAGTDRGKYRKKLKKMFVATT